MAVPLAERILKVAEEGLSLWKTFIATRQEAYNRQQDKKQVAAIEAAEKYILYNEKLLVRLKLEEEKEFRKDLAYLKRYYKRFFHYN